MNAHLICLLLHFIMIHKKLIEDQIRVLILIALASITTLCSGQNANNPFEIKNRIAEETVEIITPTYTSKVINDLDSRDTIRLYTPPAATPQTELIVVNREGEDKVLSLVSGQNPFEVNHVPLRKSAIVRTTTIGSKSQNSSNRGNNSNSKAFIFWVITTALILLVLSFASSTKMMGNVTKSILNENILKLEHRSKQALSLGYLLLYLVYFLNAGVFAMLLWNHLGEGVVTFSNFLKCTGLVIVVYLIRHISMAILGAIFPLGKEAGLYSFTIQVFNSFIGVVLIPLNLLLAFGPESMNEFAVYLSLGLLAILLIIRLIRGLVISLNHVFGNLLLFFIYLCSLEIAPVLVLIRFLQNY